nr:endochitinase-like [Aedes albopictus]XP_029712642.1 endochitinase-like [Aedes albopictus]
MVVTTKQLNTVLSDLEYPPLSEKDAEIIVGQTNDMTDDFEEAVMFLTQLIHESGGFQHTSEDEGSEKEYAPYYGRGYIQLTYEENYQGASMAIFGDERLVKNPKMVSDSVEMSMRVSVWFWEAKVRPAVGPSNHNFNRTTQVINGELEPPGSDKAKGRHALFIKVFNSFCRVANQNRSIPKQDDKNEWCSVL